jgi:TolB-like protein
LLLLGCGGSTVRVPIQIKVQSEIDVGRYSNFAVLPFAEEQPDAREMNAPEETREAIAAMMRLGLGRHKNFHVIGTQETTRMLTGETINSDMLSNVSELVRLGRYFEADALVAGSYKFYTISEPRRYYGERYSIQLQRYVTDYQDYLHRTYVLSLRVLIVDMDTEKIVWDEKYDRSAAEAHTFGSFLVSQVTPHDGILKNLMKQAIEEFTRKIAPHYETEERFLVK